MINLIKLITKDPKIIIDIVSSSTENISNLVFKFFKWLFVLMLIIYVIGLFNNMWLVAFLSKFEIINSIFDDSKYFEAIRDFIGVILGGILALLGSLMVNKKQNTIKNNLMKNEKIYNPLYSELIDNKLIFYYDGSEIFKSLEGKEAKNEEILKIGRMDSLDNQRIIQIILPEYYEISKNSEYLILNELLKSYYSNFTYELLRYFHELNHVQDEIKECINKNYPDEKMEVDKWMCRILEYILKKNHFEFDIFFKNRIDSYNTGKVLLYFEIIKIPEIKYIEAQYKKCLKEKTKIINLLEYIIKRNIQKSGDSLKWYT